MCRGWFTFLFLLNSIFIFSQNNTIYPLQQCNFETDTILVIYKIESQLGKYARLEYGGYEKQTFFILDNQKLLKRNVNEVKQKGKSDCAWCERIHIYNQDSLVYSQFYDKKRNQISFGALTSHLDTCYKSTYECKGYQSYQDFLTRRNTNGYCFLRTDEKLESTKYLQKIELVFQYRDSIDCHYDGKFGDWHLEEDIISVFPKLNHNMIQVKKQDCYGAKIDIQLRTIDEQIDSEKLIGLKTIEYTWLEVIEDRKYVIDCYYR